MSTCSRCKKEFKDSRALGQHQRHVREAKALGRKERLCPDNRTDEEARASALLASRVRAKWATTRPRGTKP
jgi:hypothetical protein